MLAPMEQEGGWKLEQLGRNPSVHEKGPLIAQGEVPVS